VKNPRKPDGTLCEVSERYAKSRQVSILISVTCYKRLNLAKGKYSWSSPIRTFTPALPFCHFTTTAEKPKDFRYPSRIKTLGDRLRARRLDLGLEQKRVARLLGVSEDTVCYWENNRVKPSRRLGAKVKNFLDSS
jgi:DNA-binding XRE family transcriptional regulator